MILRSTTSPRYAVFFEQLTVMSAVAFFYSLNDTASNFDYKTANGRMIT